MAGKTPRKVAVIDQGSNTLLVLIAQIGEQGCEVLHEQVYYPRLGQGVRKNKKLSPQAMRRSFSALLAALEECKKYDASEIYALGTSALRVAKNRTDYLSRVARECGLHIKVISEKEEARLSFIAAASDLQLQAGERVVVLDIGGSSSEVAVSYSGDSTRPRVAASLPWGAVTLTEELSLRPPLTEEQIDSLERELEKKIDKIPAARHPLILAGTAGTFTTLAALDIANKVPRSKIEQQSLEGHCLTLATLQESAAKLFRSSIQTIKKMPGMDPNRADIICAGVGIALFLVQHFEGEEVLIRPGGIRKGFLIELMKK